MSRFIAGRLLSSLVVLWAIVTISFFLMRFAPGSPFDEDRRLPPAVEANKWLLFGLGEAVFSPLDGTVTSVADVVAGRDYPAGTALCVLTTDSGKEVRVSMRTSGKLVSLHVEEGDLIRGCAEQDCSDGVDSDGNGIIDGDRIAVIPKSLVAQYWSSLVRYARLDFGVTIASDGQRTVWENLKAALPISLELGLWALLIALFFGIGAGLVAGLKQNTWVDHVVMSFAMLGISVPTIVSGPLFIFIFIFGLGWFDYGGWSSWSDKVLPIMTLGLVYTAYFARLTRGGMLEVIHSDYIRTARAKGLSERAVVLRHALKGALLPTVSFLGPAVARIVTGSIVVERVFGLPGLSEYFITPALNRDYPMVLGVVVLYSALLVLMNLMVDIAYTYLDPRVSYD